MPLGSPRARVGELSQWLARGGEPLKREQVMQMRQIFEEEFARAKEELPPTDTTPTEADLEKQREQIKICYDRIQSRAESVLNVRQSVQFKSFAGMWVNRGRQEVQPRWGRNEAFYHWLIDLYFFVILPLQCVKGCGGLIRDELQADTLGFLVTRPLYRAALLVAKYLAQTLWLQLFLVLETLLLFLAGSRRGLPDLGSLLPHFLVAQILAVPAWCALGIFLGQVSKRYLALAMVYGFIVEMGIGRIPPNINPLSLIRHLKVLLAHNPRVQSIYEWAGTGVPLSVTALLLAACIFLAAAALLFTFREYHHTAEMQK